MIEDGAQERNLATNDQDSRQEVPKQIQKAEYLQDHAYHTPPE